MKTFSEAVDSYENPGIGIRMGPGSNIIDFEYDTPAQEAKLKELFGGELPDCPYFTSRKGAHYLFRYDGRLDGLGATVSILCEDGTKLLVRIGKGSQSAFPPSENKQWVRSVDDCELPYLPDEVVRVLHKTKSTSSSSTSSSSCDSAHVGALADMLRIEVSESENDGSNRLFKAAIRAVEHGLSDAQAVVTVREYMRQRPFPKDRSEAEILQRVRQAEERPDVRRGSRVVISNYRDVSIEGKDRRVPLSMREVVDSIRSVTDWPCRLGSTLFVDDEYGVSTLDSTSALFGWLRTVASVKWTESGSFVKQSELFAELCRTAQAYDCVQQLPHEPPILGVYYCNSSYEPGDMLEQLLDRFRPATPLDRWLLKAMILTQFWGGPTGARPAFVFTSDDGRGAGKTKTAEMVGYLAGGTLDVQATENIGAIKTRILSKEGQEKRVVLIDNLKSDRFGSEGIEAVITAPVISGKKLYAGEGRLPNYWTWIITLNGVSLSTDMSQRCVIIKVTKGKNDPNWIVETQRFIDENREALIGDILSTLRSEPQPLDSYNRWAAWEEGVLSRLEDPAALQELIAERQQDSDCDTDEAGIIEQLFADKLESLGLDADECRVRIPVALVAEWYAEATGERSSTAIVSRRLNQMATEGAIARLAREPGRSKGRCFVWTGSEASAAAPITNEVVLKHQVSSSLS